MPYSDYKKPRLQDELVFTGPLSAVLPATLDILAIEYVTMTAGTNVLDIGSFETGSQLKIEPITRTDNRGLIRPVAYKLTGTLISVSNNLEIFPDLFDEFTGRPVQLDVYLTGSGVETSGRPTRYLNFSKSDRSPLFDGWGIEEPFDNRVSMTYSVEISDDHRIRLVMNITGWLQNWKFCHVPLP